MAKLFASEMAKRVVQIFGGRGDMRENVTERLFRELRVDRIWKGTSDIQRLIIARSLLKRGPGGLYSMLLQTPPSCLLFRPEQRLAFHFAG